MSKLQNALVMNDLKDKLSISNNQSNVLQNQYLAQVETKTKEKHHKARIDSELTGGKETKLGPDTLRHHGAM